MFLVVHIKYVSVIKRMKLNRKNIQSRGLGDSIHKITQATGIKAVVDKVNKVTGKDCGCSERRDTLNRLFPYNK